MHHETLQIYRFAVDIKVFNKPTSKHDLSGTIAARLGCRLTFS